MLIMNTPEQQKLSEEEQKAWYSSRRNWRARPRCPVLDRLDERVLHRILGQADVAEAGRQRGAEPPRLSR